MDHEGLTMREANSPHYETTWICLPRPPTVAYLCLVSLGPGLSG